MVIVKDEKIKKEQVGNIEYGIVFKFGGKYYQKIRPNRFEHPDYDAVKHRVVIDLELNELCIIAVDALVIVVDAQLVVNL